MFVAASFASGISEFYGLKELKIKESNRLSSMSNALSKNGVKLELGTFYQNLREETQEGGNHVETKMIIE